MAEGLVWEKYNIAGPLVPFNHAPPKRGLIHRDRESYQTMLYLQATTAGCPHDT